MIRTFLEGRRVRRAFKKLVAPETVETILREGGVQPSIKEGQLARDVKIVRGAADGHHGLFGNDTRLSYTFVVPQFDAILGALSRFQFGESEEFRR